MKENSTDFLPFVEDDEGFDNYIVRMQKVPVHSRSLPQLHLIIAEHCLVSRPAQNYTGCKENPHICQKHDCWLKSSQETTWAGHMEVQAASLCYEANIHIYQSGQPTWRVINFTPMDSHRCFHLSYHDGEHYNSVRGQDDPGDGPAQEITIQPCTMDVVKLQAQVCSCCPRMLCWLWLRTNVQSRDASSNSSLPE